MTLISDVYIAMKLAELAKRCGLKASYVDGSIGLVDAGKDPEGKGYFRVDFVSGACPPEEEGKADKFFNLLGMKDHRTLKVAELEDLEDIVDQALSLAPRARSI